MSYCRWSSDRMMCDVYVYEAENGYVCHIATHRPDIPGPLFPMDEINSSDKAVSEAAIHKYNVELAEWRAKHKLVALNLPRDGEGVVLDTPGEMADFLEDLESMGYHVPYYAISRLRLEQNDHV